MSVAQASARKETPDLRQRIKICDRLIMLHYNGFCSVPYFLQHITPATLCFALGGGSEDSARGGRMRGKEISENVRGSGEREIRP